MIRSEDNIRVVIDAKGHKQTHRVVDQIVHREECARAIAKDAVDLSDVPSREWWLLRNDPVLVWGRGVEGGSLGAPRATGASVYHGAGVQGKWGA